MISYMIGPERFTEIWDIQASLSTDQHFGLYVCKHKQRQQLDGYTPPDSTTPTLANQQLHAEKLHKDTAQCLVLRCLSLCSLLCCSRTICNNNLVGPYSHGNRHTLATRGWHAHQRRYKVHRYLSIPGHHITPIQNHIFPSGTL